MPRDTDGCTTVRNTRAKVTNVTSLVTPSETEFVVFPINGDMFQMTLCELCDRLIDVLHSSGLTHSECAEIGVTTSPIPITLERFGVERDLDTPLFGDANQEVTCDPEMITHGDAFTGTDLELPLGGHDLCIDTADVHASV